MTKKRVKITVTKKKVNIKKVVISLLILISLIATIVYIAHIPIKNIYISGNNILSDKEIIYLAGIDNYPPVINTYFSDIKEKLLKNDYIKSAKITRTFFGKIYIDIEEYRPLAIYNDELILSSGKRLKNELEIEYIPYIINDIDGLYDKFIESFSKVNDDILFKISHIEYSPNEVDKERFILYMIDKNYVHITLNKIEKINKYNSIVNELGEKKGIVYLDSGDYVEIKK